MFVYINVGTQTMLNNFGVSKIFKTYPGYTKFSFIDYNSDGIDDLILYGNQSKNFVLHQGLADSTFGPAEKKFFFFPIDDFKWFNTSENGKNFYIFVSRNKRIAGIVSFTSNFSLRLLNQIDFNSYPSSVDILDLNNDSKNEAIIFGPNFNGIDLVELNGFRLSITPELEQNVFRDVALIDFNNDDYEDFVAVDILNSSINFIENYSDYEIAEKRKITFNEPLFNIKQMYYNNDDFVDLAVSKEGGIEILLGDSVYSYSQKVKFNYGFTPGKFEINDFNQNGFKDIAIVNKLNNEVIIDLYNKDSHDAINYFLDGITDMKYLKNKINNSILLLSKNGVIQKIGSENKWGKDFNFSVGGNPKFIYVKRSSSTNDKIIVADQINNSVSILNKDESGKFTKIIKDKFVNANSSFCWSPKTNLFAGYTINNRLIEIRSLEQKQKSPSQQNFIYTANPIEQLMIDSSDNFISLQKFNNKLFFQEISLDSSQYKSNVPVLLDTSVTTVMLNKPNDMYYWQRSNGKLRFISFKNNVKKEIVSITSVQDSNSNTVIIDRLRKNIKESIVTILHQNGKEQLILFNGKNKTVFKITNSFLSDLKIDKHSFWFFIDKNKGHYLYVKKANIVQKYKMDFLNKSLYLADEIETQNIIDFFIQDFSGKLYLVYTTSDNLIKFKRI